MTMSLAPVRARVAELAHGRRRNRRLAVLIRTLFYGLCAAAVAAWFLPIQTTLLGLVGLVLIAIAVAVVAALMIPVDPVVIAKRFDDAAGTKDLLSSSLELGDESDPFVRAVHEDACVRASGTGPDARTVFPTRVPREARWLPYPLAGCAAALLFLLFTSSTPPLKTPSVEEMNVRLNGAQLLQDLQQRLQKDQLSELDSERLQRLKELEELLKNERFSRKDTLAELAKLASQLDKQRQELEGKKLAAEKNATRLAKGEDLQDAERDMQGGKYREAATKVEKKIAELQKKLDELKKNNGDKLEIEKLEQRVKKLQQLLAELLELDAIGKNLGFEIEVLDALDRIEGELGQLGEFDGETFDNVQLGRPKKRQAGDENEDGARQLFAFPTNEAGRGHNKEVQGKARRALTERQEEEARLREGKGKSAFGQVKTANDRSKSQLAYKDAALAAKQAAEDAIYRQNIPAGYRTYIRSYFESMQPDEHESRTEASAQGEQSPQGGAGDAKNK
ncbi:MAG: hypothetical protein R3F56_21885 [Planctomycetota bacterium]